MAHRDTSSRDQDADARGGVGVSSLEVLGAHLGGGGE